VHQALAGAGDAIRGARLDAFLRQPGRPATCRALGPPPFVQSGGTWTQPTHIHDGLGSETGSHTLTLVEIPSHRHDFNGFNAFTIVGGHAGESHAGKPYVPFTDYQGGGGSHKHDLSGMSADGTPSTWRPYGRNFTRQQKN
jgi:hypothetical protein